MAHKSKSPYLKYPEKEPFPILNKHSHYYHLFEEMYEL